jgi:hypothetical protein
MEEAWMPSNNMTADELLTSQSEILELIALLACSYAEGRGRRGRAVQKDWSQAASEILSLTTDRMDLERLLRTCAIRASRKTYAQIGSDRENCMILSTSSQPKANDS